MNVLCSIFNEAILVTIAYGLGKPGSGEQSVVLYDMGQERFFSGIGFAYINKMIGFTIGANPSGGELYVIIHSAAI